MKSAVNFFGVKFRRRCTIGLFIFVAGLMVCGSRASAQLVQVATDKDVYYQGEPIQISIHYLGTGALGFSSSIQSQYTLDGTYTRPNIGLTVLTSAVGPCGWTHIFNWRDHSLEPGIHSVGGTVVGYGVSGNAWFSIIQMPEPQTDFLLDFDHWPGSTTEIYSHVAYEAFRVKFRSSLGSNSGSRVGLSGISGDSCMYGFDPYPIGFNVAADFSLPVFGVSAQAKASASTTVTMIAKDAQGQVIGRVESPPTQQMWQPLELWSEIPIASIEWWPSKSNSSCDVDNMWVHLSPKLSPSISNGLFTFTSPTLIGKTYQVWSSSNMLEWIPAGPACGGTNGVATNEFMMDDERALFYRVGRTANPD